MIPGRFTLRIFIVLIGCYCPVLVPGTKANEEVWRVHRERLVKSVEEVEFGSNPHTFLVRIIGGVIPLPQEFVLHSVQGRGKLFRLESITDPESALFHSSIWIWNKDEKLTTLFDSASEIKEHPIELALRDKCNQEVVVKEATREIPGTSGAFQAVYVDLGEQIVSADKILESLLLEMFTAYARLNCALEGTE